MAIADADFVMYAATVQNDTTSNGGRIDDSTVIPNNTSGALFPTRESAYLTAGGTRSRKLFRRTESATEYPTVIREWLVAPTAEGDRLYLTAATDTDTQASRAAPAYYGAGDLNAGVSAAATSITVAVENGATTIFRDGDLIHLDDGTNSEFATISGAPSVSADVVTITLSAGLTHTYAAGGATQVASVLEIGNRQPGAGTPSVTSAAGTFASAQVTVNPDSAIPDTITFTFTSATAFTAAGVAAGALGSGTVGATFAPTNPNTGTAYFSIAAAAWGGTFVAGDTVEIDINATVWAFWLDLVTPAGSTPTGAINNGVLDTYLEGVLIP